MAGGRRKRAAGTHLNLQLLGLFPPSLLQLAHRTVEVFDPGDENRPLALEVVGEQNVRRPIGELDLRDPRAHSLDCERQPATEHASEVLRIGGDVGTGRVEIVDLYERERHGPAPRRHAAKVSPAPTPASGGTVPAM